MKRSIFTNWTFMRFLRLGAGLAILVQAVIVKDVLFALIGLGITAMAVFNAGCCGTSDCYVPAKKNVNTTKDIIYEEVV